MKIAICDDNQIELYHVEQIIKEFVLLSPTKNDITIKAFRSGLELLSFANAKTSIDLFILDIIMPDINGIEVAEEIRKINKDCKIIFLTASPEFAVNSYSVDAYYYLLKPVEKEKLFKVLNKATIDIEEEKSESILIRDKGRLTRLPIHSIKYVESIKHTIHFHLHNGDVAVCYGKMDEFSNVLLMDKRFVQCHRSFVVNMNFIASLEKKCFVLIDKTFIPISRTVFITIKNTYINYFFSKENGVLT